MTTYFRTIAQINVRADYDKILRKALDKAGQEPFHYFDAYPFDKKEAPLVLVGDVAKSIIGDLKKAAPRAQYAMGMCTVSDGEILFERETGKLQPRLVSAALKLSGIKTAVTFRGEEEAEAEAEVQEPKSPPPTGDKPSVVTPPTVDKQPVNKPTGPVHPHAKEWQDKVKILRPAFDQALKKARGQALGTWAEDLDSTFTQMVQEAKANDFDTALRTLARLARMVKSEEAGRAEAKHHSEKEDPSYAEMYKQSMSEQVGDDDARRMRKQAKSDGYGTTEDGNVTYALPVKPGEWKSDVLDQLDALDRLLQAKPVDADALQPPAEKVSLMARRAQMHATQADGQFPDHERSLSQIDSANERFNTELGKFFMIGISRDPDQLSDAAVQLRKDIVEALKKPVSKTGSAELDAFARQLQQRKQEREEHFKREAEAIKRLAITIAQFEDSWESMDPDDLAEDIQQLKLKARMMESTRAERQQRLKNDIAQHRNGETDRAELARFSSGWRRPACIQAISQGLEDMPRVIKAGSLDLAADAVWELVTMANWEGFGAEQHEVPIMQNLQALHSHLSNAAQAKAASPRKAVRALQTLRAEAQAFARLLS